MFISHLYRHFSLICWAPAIPQALYVSGHILKAWYTAPVSGLSPCPCFQFLCFEEVSRVFLSTSLFLFVLLVLLHRL